MSDNHIEDLVIVGSGPAGWTAAIYGARANLNPLVYEGAGHRTMIPGGQLMFTTDVENYPGFADGIGGIEMMMEFKKQAMRFDTRVVTDDIVQVNFVERPFELVSAGGDGGARPDGGRRDRGERPLAGRSGRGAAGAERRRRVGVRRVRRGAAVLSRQGDRGGGGRGQRDGGGSVHDQVRQAKCC